MHHLLPMIHFIRFFWTWLLCLGLSHQALHAQLYLALTAEAYLPHDSMPRPGRYHLEGTTAFVEGLIEAHLAGKLTLYRDFEKQLPYPDRATFGRYLDEQRHPEWDEALEALAKEPGVRDSLDRLEARRRECADCLSAASRWFLQAGLDSTTLRSRVASPEEQLSLFKQIGKSRELFRSMAGLAPDQPHRYLMFSARFDQTEEQARLQWEQGILLVSHFPLGDQGQAPILHALFFEAEAEAIPWFLLKTTSLLAGIREEIGAQALLTEFRSDMAPLGYRLITQAVSGKWQNLHLYPSGEGRAADSLRKDSARRSWQLDRALMSAEQRIERYPRQSKAVSRWLPGHWTPDNLAQQPLNVWALDEQEAFDWEATHSILSRFTPQLLSDLDSGQLVSYVPGQGHQDLRVGEERPFVVLCAQREDYALGLLREGVPRSGTAGPDTLPLRWQSLREQTYSWRLRGEAVWLMGEKAFQPLWIDLFWEVPMDSAAPYPFLSIAWDDFKARGYLYDGDPLTEVLIGEEYGYYLTQVNASVITDLSQATMLRLILAEGAWDAFPTWLMAQQDPPATGKGQAEDWKQAWKDLRRAMRRSAYR
jgi:hypothetical protein